MISNNFVCALDEGGNEIILRGPGIGFKKQAGDLVPVSYTHLPFVCIGAGCGIFGHGVGDMANRWALRKHPELERQMQIEKDDERNVAISNRAKAKAYDGMLFVLAALMVSFALMGADMAVVLLLVFAYLFIVGEFIYYLNKYQKEM